MSASTLFWFVFALFDYASALNIRSDGVAGDLDDHDTLLWSGSDLQDQSTERSFALKPLAGPSMPERGLVYELMGAFDSGTNLMERLIKDNFPESYTRVANKQKRDGRWLWKHSNSGAPSLYETLESEIPTYNISDVVAIAMVRSPLSQVVSWKHSPYDLAPCMTRTWETMDRPCRAKVGAALYEEQYRIGRLQTKYSWVHFTSTMEVYNSYITQYHQLQKDRKFRKVAIIRYEDLVYEPERIVKQLSQLLELPVPATVKVPGGPQSPGKTPKGRTAALLSLSMRTWMLHLSKRARSVLCSPPHGLNRSLVADMTDARQHKYTEDCD